MASVDSGGKGEKLNVELNLVPFIDLLSTLVLFLLVTAVWMQISAIPAAVQSKGKSAASPAIQKTLQIRLTPKGYSLVWPAVLSSLPSTIKNVQTGYNLELLAGIIKANSEKISSASVSAEDSVNYGEVIQAIDTAKMNGVSAVALSTD
jgi:biopolymer transport protein TolR